jgi:ABC-type xylose transport system permease subunit
MAQDTPAWRPPKFWIVLLGVVILLIFLYFYQPFETYLVKHIPGVHFSNVVFWFASLVGVVGYVVAHWQSYRQHIFRASSALDVEALVFDTLQIAILIAVIFCAGATIQAIEMLAEHLMNRGAIIEVGFGEKLLAIILLVLLAIAFYLLHHLVRSFRQGWNPRRPPPSTSSGD